MKYRVRYELETNTTNVIIELGCKDKAEADALYEQRRCRSDLKDCKIIEIPEE